MCTFTVHIPCRSRNTSCGASLDWNFLTSYICYCAGKLFPNLIVLYGLFSPQLLDRRLGYGHGTRIPGISVFGASAGAVFVDVSGGRVILPGSSARACVPTGQGS